MTEWIGIDSGPGGELYFKDKNSKLTLIWPFLGTGGDPMLFTNDMAFFIADMPDEQGRLGSGECFAVQAPGPALDVSEDILKLWAEANNLKFQNLKRYYSPINVQEVGGGIKIHYVGGERFPENPEATYIATWEQVSNIIQDVKRTGKQHVIDNPVLKLHVVYLKKDYSSTNETK